MYGIVEVKGHQYKVTAGDLIDVQKMDAEEGSEVVLDRVLFTGGDEPQVGLPTVSGAKITAKVVLQARSRKEIVFKRKPHHRTVKRGHRQHFTALLITSIDNGNGNVTSIDKDSKLGKKHL